jgi:predicted TIM-barrel fold metal-dependent hydrolase
VEPLALRPEYQDPANRIERLDAQGIDACLLFPTLASGVEELIREDVALLMDVLWTFNRWMADVWTFHYEDRMFGAPMFALSDVDTAVDMLNWAIDEGARVIDVRSAPVLTPLGFRSPGDPMFDRFWARCEEAGVMIGIHGGPVNYTKYSGDWCGEYVWRAFAKTPFEHIANHGRPISDFLTAMITHGACSRFPELKLISVENGGDWVPDLIKTMKLIYQRYPGGFPEDPVAAFERNVWVSPFWEDPIEEIARYVPVERILAGSDFPHAEGLSEPTDFIKGIADFSPADQRRIMRDNLAALLGHDS